jgi:hypothetical protein
VIFATLLIDTALKEDGHRDVDGYFPTRIVVIGYWGIYYKSILRIRLVA